MWDTASTTFGLCRVTLTVVFSLRGGTPPHYSSPAEAPKNKWVLIPALGGGGHHSGAPPSFPSSPAEAARNRWACLPRDPVWMEGSGIGAKTGCR